MVRVSDYMTSDAAPPAWTSSAAMLGAKEIARVKAVTMEPQATKFPRIISNSISIGRKILLATKQIFRLEAIS